MAETEKRRQKNVGPRSGQRIPVKVTVEEKERIELTARKVRLPASTLLRKLVLGYEPPSMIDLDTLSTLTRLRGDFGRLGGLLKLWLVDAPGQAVPESEVRAALDTILAKQGELSNLIVAIEKATGN
ncbi:conjugal transfer protein TraJ [Gluconobacter sp. R75690]|uniref:plasmid mobilization protein n=1 Tax=unclassified Gluconobacter TaxID=2644261 RepID=UPI00188A3EAE|nr:MULTISPECIES: conjugal transfer protein TraJ [unclassified Gluconobacter]MBF0849768.1 conjugal transfer protein TraJ [Gluconobacter sp. R75690]MBF0878003.1 conjugal transfer protein TraJ [Gluconobacter sp. R75828]